MNSATPWVSIVIPVYNEEKLLPTCIDRVRRACDACDAVARCYEIIVCDNNSSDRTAEIAALLGCRVVFEPVNQISRARNRGASIATGECLLFIDADSWPSPELLAEAASKLRNPKYIGCGSTIRIVDGPWWFKWAWESKNLSMRVLKWCPGGFIFCRRDAFVAIGGFPLDRYIFEEAEFVKRLKALAAKRGQKFTVLHRHPFTASGRKGREFGFWSWFKTALALWRSPARRIRDKDFAGKWDQTKR